MNYTFNSLQPNVSIFPQKDLSFNDIGCYTERALQDSYNTFLIDIFFVEQTIFESVILNEDDVKLIGKDDAAYKQDQKDKKKEERKAKREELKNKLKDGGLKEIIEKWFKAAWEKIKGFFAKISEKIKNITNEAKKKHGMNLGKQFLEAIDKIEKTDKDFTIRGYSRNFLKQSVLAADKISSELISYMETTNNYIAKIENENEDQIKEKMNEFNDKFNKDAIINKLVPGRKFSDLGSVPKYYKYILKIDQRFSKQQIRKGLEGQDYEFSEVFNLEELKKYSGYFINVIFNNNDWLGAVMKKYNDAKKLLTISRNNGIKAFLKKDKNYDMTMVKEYIAAINNGLAVLIKLTNLGNASFAQIRMNYVDIVKHVIAKGKGKDLDKMDADDDRYVKNKYSVS